MGGQSLAHTQRVSHIGDVFANCSGSHEIPRADEAQSIENIQSTHKSQGIDRRKKTRLLSLEHTRQKNNQKDNASQYSFITVSLQFHYRHATLSAGNRSTASEEEEEQGNPERENATIDCVVCRTETG